MIKKLILCFITALLIIVNGCRNSNTSDIVFLEGTEDRILLKDINEREWDITYAVNEFDMDKEHFHFGIGFGAIPSVDKPKVLSNTSENFPAPDDIMQIFGVNLEGEFRGYSKYEMKKHEVFNDVYGGNKYKEVLIGFCPIYDLAAVYDRYLTSHRKILTFAASGWTYGETSSNSLFVLTDKESFSLWHPMKRNGTRGLYCISGFYQGEYLEEIQFMARESWDDWFSMNPSTKFVTNL